jgi:polar amino acid transport system substrate-binding protein
MNDLRTAVIAGGVALAVYAAGALVVGNGSPTGPANDAAFERVISSKVIKCGYVPYPPGLIKDPNTGKITGIFPETLEASAKDLGYQIKWTEEVGWGTMIEGLKAGRYDAICSPVWANSTRAQFAEFTQPFFYSGIGVYVRADERRFGNGLEGINSDGVTLATIDGEMTSIVADQDYPEAKRVALPQNSDVSQVLLNVLNHKADVTFVEPFVAEEFMKSHPGALRNLVAAKPVRIFPNTMLVAKGNYALKGLLDVMVSEMTNSGRADRLIAKYDLGSGTFYPLAQPYRQPVGNGAVATK